jgi:hypothetical protein
VQLQIVPSTIGWPDTLAAGALLVAAAGVPDTVERVLLEPQPATNNAATRPTAANHFVNPMCDSPSSGYWIRTTCSDGLSVCMTPLATA